MSHFTTVETHISDLEILKAALEDLKFVVESNETQVVWIKGWQDNEIPVDLAVSIKGCEYGIGFKKTAHNLYEIVADWWGIEQIAGISQKMFVNQLTQRYAYHKVLAEVKKQGFLVAENRVEKDQSIRLVLRKWS